MGEAALSRQWSSDFHQEPRHLDDDENSLDAALLVMILCERQMKLLLLAERIIKLIVNSSMPKACHGGLHQQGLSRMIPRYLDPDSKLCTTTTTTSQEQKP